jgi:hypothetical protein
MNNNIDDILRSTNALFQETNIDNINDKIRIVVYNTQKFFSIKQVSNMINLEQIEYRVTYEPTLNGPEHVREVPELIANIVNLDRWTAVQRHLLTVIIAVFSLTEWKNDLAGYAGIAFISNENGYFYHKLDNRVASINVLEFNLDRFDINQWITNWNNGNPQFSYDTNSMNMFLNRLNLQ